MIAKKQVSEFLTSRRARITPDAAGLPAYGGNRRVPGLRREEVALLAGVSVDYYNRLERGNLAGVSEQVLDALARALRLDEAEQAHLHDLALSASAAPAKRRRSSPTRLRPTVVRLLDAMADAPAWIRNDRHDILAINRLGRALYAPVLADPRRPANTARFIFLDPAAHDFFVDWPKAATDSVAILRSTAGRNPYDRDLSDLIGELSTRSEEFRSRWAAHDVRFHRTGRKLLHHPVVGELDLEFEAMTLTSDPGLTFLAYTAEPGTASADALRVLASWAATQDLQEADAPGPPEHPDDPEEDLMQHRTPTGTVKTPAANFTGDVYLNRVFGGDDVSPLVVGLVRFTPGARTSWHVHANGQLLVCTDGAGLVGTRDGTVVRLQAGESVWTPAGEEHWHGGRADQMMSHYAILDETSARDATTWLEPVTDEQYAAAHEAP